MATLSCSTARQDSPPGTAALKIVMNEKEAVPMAQSYAGAESCRACHGSIYRFWMGTGHAKSLQSLMQQDREGEVSCLRCHVTGFGEESGYGSEGIPNGLSSVSCEACHGPASSHAGSEEPGREIPSLGSECPPCEINRSCRMCHTGRWSPDFRLGPMLEKISCRQGKSLPPEDRR